MPAERPAGGGQDQPVDGARRLRRAAAGRAPSARSRPGSRARRCASASCITSSPPTTRLSLLASARSMPSPSVATVGPSPAEPTSPFRTRSAPDSAIRRTHALGPAQHLSPVPGVAGPLGGARLRERDPRRRRARRPARAAAPTARRRRGPTTSSSSLRATTSSACVADRAGRAEDHELPHRGQSRDGRPGRPRRLEERLRHVVADDDREEGGVEAVERAAVLAEEAAACPSRSRSRLIIDSKRSPSGAASDTQTPITSASAADSQSW